MRVFVDVLLFKEPITVLQICCMHGRIENTNFHDFHASVLVMLFPDLTNQSLQSVPNCNLVYANIDSMPGSGSLEPIVT